MLAVVQLWHRMDDQRMPQGNKGTGGTPKKRRTYLHEPGGTEAGASIEPVIIAQLVDLDALFVRRLMRHGLCHHHRLNAPLGIRGVLKTRDYVWC